jgi:hypothetical protein
MDTARTLVAVAQGLIWGHAVHYGRGNQRRGFANHTERIFRIGLSGTAVLSGSNLHPRATLRVNPVKSSSPFKRSQRIGYILHLQHETLFLRQLKRTN